jgi:Protein of unknown function (DUF2752)
MTPETRPLSRWVRFALVVLALALATMLGIASRLEPDPRGFGTHVQLGLPPCSFRQATGYNCPSCGMTTAMAWLARGRLDRSWSANPGGVAIGLLALGLIPWLVASAATGRPWRSRTIVDPLVWCFVAAVAWSVLAWTFRLIFVWRVLG